MSRSSEAHHGCLCLLPVLSPPFTYISAAGLVTPFPISLEHDELVTITGPAPSFNASPRS